MVLAMIAALLATASGASAQDRPVSIGERIPIDLPDGPEPTISDAPDKAELEDLGELAKSFGISLDEAVLEYGWRDNLSMVVHTIREEFPEAFSGSGMTEDGDIWIGYSSDIPRRASSALAEFQRAFPHVSVEQRSGLGFTEAEMLDAMARAHFSVYRTAGVKDAVTDFSYETNDFTIYVSAESETNPLNIASLSDAALRAIETEGNQLARSEKDSFSVVMIDEGTATLSSDDSGSYHYGGEALSSCTSGFGTRSTSHTSGTRGISTAGHCGDSLTDDGDTLWHQDGYDGWWGDFQWHTGAASESDDFYSGNASTLETKRRDVNGVQEMAVWGNICANGKITFKDCQGLDNINTCVAENCNLVRTDARLKAPGDSGGPVFWGRVAFGLHEGWVTIDGNLHDTYSKSTAMDNAIDVYIATS